MAKTRVYSPNTHSPHGSGFLRGSGGVRRTPRTAKSVRRNIASKADWTLLDLANSAEIKRSVPDFDPDESYTDRELLLIAEKILLTDDRTPKEYPMWLNWAMYKRRYKNEVYTSIGTPDPSIVEGSYWKTHPKGRRFRIERGIDDGFYY